MDQRLLEIIEMNKSVWFTQEKNYGRSQVRDPMERFFLSIYLILPATLGSEVHSTSNRNECPKQEK
jgi:hypothetical protein